MTDVLFAAAGALIGLVVFGIGLWAKHILYRIDAHRINPQVREALNTAYYQVKSLRTNGKTVDAAMQAELDRANQLFNDGLKAIHEGGYRTAWARAKESIEIVDRIRPAFKLPANLKPVPPSICIYESPGTLVWFGKC